MSLMKNHENSLLMLSKHIVTFLALELLKINFHPPCGSPLPPYLHVNIFRQMRFPIQKPLSLFLLQSLLCLRREFWKMLVLFPQVYKNPLQLQLSYGNASVSNRSGILTMISSVTTQCLKLSRLW